MSVESEQRRLALLQYLKQDTDYSANDGLLKAELKQQGMGCSFAVLAAELAWLKELELISLHSLPTGQVATLRSRGLEVVEGDTVIPGIARMGLN